MPKKISNVRTKDGIEWHCEQQGCGPHVVLIPSGEGDCESYSKSAALLAHSFTVTTFDMPGMSRSIAPTAAMENITPALLASQIIGLVDELDIDVATFYGCSSGALVALTLVANHADRVRNAIVHEAPLDQAVALNELMTLDDAEIVSKCRQLFATTFNENKAAWENLGAEYHARLEKNYVTWVRTYMNIVTSTTITNNTIKRRPVDWTIGALSLAGAFFGNVVMAVEAGIPISLLPCRHFPQVSIPEELAEHIKSSTVKYLSL